MLLLIDLDNTLVDRTAAFGTWASDFVRGLGKPDAEAAWLITADREGYEPRESLAVAMIDRFGLDTGVEAVVQTLLFDHVELMVMDPFTTAALSNARELGWRIGIVTNGATEQQTRKIQHLGLGPYVDCVVISEAAGMKKPDVGIFHVAARELGGDVVGGWMIGDHPIADIGGGRAAGMRTAWVSRGSDWPAGEPKPTLARGTAAEAIDAVVQATPG